MNPLLFMILLCLGGASSTEITESNSSSGNWNDKFWWKGVVAIGENATVIKNSTLLVKESSTSDDEYCRQTMIRYT